ncbi:MAG TPA: hypothetical protein VLE49_09435 [Anaerolineales bacterium]|nr:hypothetical protein [Anaerolineales bacterium]
MMRISPAEANDILSKRYPTLEELKRFPFGKLLFRLYKSRDKENKNFKEHAEQVLDSMNKLLSDDPNTLFQESIAESDKSLFTEAKGEIGKIFNNFDESTCALFRLGALYHDIGKYIIKERHPTIGWYTMEYIDPREKDKLRSLLGSNEDSLQLLLIMIRDHDQFGVLSTGEASYPILLRAANSVGNDPDDKKKILSALMWLNLADMAGTPGLVLNPDDLRKVFEDWKWLCHAIDKCHQDGVRLDDHVIKEASLEDQVVERITRLLLEACRGIPLRDKELRQTSSREQVLAKVRNAIHTVYPTDIPRSEFASELTHICKLDYGKRFFASLVEYYEGPRVSGEKRILKKWSKEYVKTEDLIYSVLAILRRLSSTYAAMIRSEVGPGNLIGVEMKDLTPRNAPEKTAQIIELLYKSHYPGLSWMMSDCLAWYF